MDLPVMSEVLFDVTKETPQGYAAECLTKRAIEEHFAQGPKPQSVRLHLVRDEVISLT